ncbi:MAG: MerR family transcriptional regulator, partial [Treponema sp.]|nr:MerR family transcriptional regulator [Treponema sp.]
MGSYTLNDAVRLLRVKVHVIRYWEKEIPLIQPEKDVYG